MPRIRIRSPFVPMRTSIVSPSTILLTNPLSVSAGLPAAVVGAPVAATARPNPATVTASTVTVLERSFIRFPDNKVTQLLQTRKRGNYGSLTLCDRVLQRRPFQAHPRDRP